MADRNFVNTYIVTSVCDYTTGILSIRRTSEAYVRKLEIYNKQNFIYLMRKTHERRTPPADWMEDEGLYGRFGICLRRVENGHFMEYRYSIAEEDDLAELNYSEKQLYDDLIFAANQAGISAAFLPDGSVDLEGKYFKRLGRCPFCFAHVISKFVHDDLMHASRNREKLDGPLLAFWQSFDSHIDEPVLSETPDEFTQYALASFAVSAMIAFKPEEEP